MDWKLFFNTKIKIYIFIILPAILLFFSLIGVTGTALHFIGYDHIYQQAVSYLHESEKASGEAFVLLSTAKSAISILESSESGISFIIDAQVQLGKVFEVLKNLIDYAWQVSIIGLSLLLITQLLLDCTQSMLYVLLIILSFFWLLHGAAEYFNSQLNQLFKRVLRSVFVACFMIIIALPLAVYGTSLISTAITANLKLHIHAGLSEHNAFYIQEGNASEDLKASTRNMLKQLQSKRKDVDQHVRKMHTYVYQHIAVLVLEAVILPLLLFWMFYHGVRLFTKGRGSDITLY